MPRSRYTRFVRRIAVATAVALLSTAAVAVEVSFNGDVRPLLSDRCFKCHGPDGGDSGENWKGGLRLDTKRGAFADLAAIRHEVSTAKRVAAGLAPLPAPSEPRFAIVPGNPEQSVLIDRIMADDPDERMPPDDAHLSLTETEKALLHKWISEGAVWDGHWSFEAPMRPDLPTVRKARWPITAVDYFILNRLENQSIEPAPEADRPTWLRRVTQDLTGLPPTIAELDAFSADHSPAAYRTVVDRLLASADYAERMTAIWLDNARYADSNGYQFDNARTMWPWRDWVIKAFQDNIPFSTFVTEQLAGDLLPDPSQAQRIATGFNRNHGYSIEGGIIDEEYRVTYANDKTTTAGTLFLGLTLECTRCHDHKYDPLTMQDYYSVYAFFNNSAEKGAPGESGRKQKAAAPFINYASTTNAPESDKVRVMVMEESPTPRMATILGQGLFDQSGKSVRPSTPAMLSDFSSYPPTRLGLAQWLVAPENPLFARVSVNRLWQQFFGVGLVKTVDNFGIQGERPSHPQLLDWLAVEFRENDWDLHHMIRNIVLSATYRQSATFRPDLEDPDNRRMARGSSFRLPAEMIRDQALAVSGLMTRDVGGPSVMPYQPGGIWEDLNAPKSHAETYKESTGSSLYRKTMYTYWRRAALHPALASFDAPSRDVCTVLRESTTTPMQALVIRHDPTYIEAARRLAERLVSEPESVALAFRMILSRVPEHKELELLVDLKAARLSHYQAHPESAQTLLQVGATPVDPNVDAARVAALSDVCHAMLNLSEAITRK